MEKRLIFAVLLSALVLTFWPRILKIKNSEVFPNNNLQQVEIKKDTKSSNQILNTNSREKISVVTSNKVEEKIIFLDNNKFNFEFSLKGGNLKKILLKEYNLSLPIENVVSYYFSDSYDFTLKQFGTLSKNQVIEFNLDWNEISQKAIKNNIAEIIDLDTMRITKNLLFDEVLLQRIFNENSEKMTILFKNAIKNNNVLTFIYDAGSYIIEKNYLLNQSDYSIKINTLIKGNISNIKDIRIKYFNINMSSLDIKDASKKAIFLRDRGMFEYAVASENSIKRKNNAYKFNNSENETINGKIDWVGFRDKYYCFIIKPMYEANNLEIEKNDESNISFSNNLNLNTNNANFQTSFIVYFGPEILTNLKKFNMDFEKIKRFYKFDLFDAIAKIIYEFMHFIHKLVPNWGLCIILISLLIYFSMYPLTIRSLLSMKRMQLMQPKIAELKEKYKKDSPKMNQELMELYKKNNINPLGGCLPLILQMPVFIGLYQVLWRSVEFNGAKFMWIMDLSQPDRLFMLPNNLPLIGKEINILPIVIAIFMAIQQQFTSKNMLSADPDQINQQKMMAIMFPILMCFVFYRLASGLTLYFLVFYILSAFTQWKMSKIKS